MALELIKLVKGSSAVAQVGSFGFFKLGVESGGGGDLTFSRVFGENTPEQISAVSAVISANNMTSAQVEEQFGWKVGDEYSIPFKLFNGADWGGSLRIDGFNHDLLSDGSGTAGITLEMTRATDYAAFNTTVINAGGYSTSTLRTATLPAWKERLPIEWQNIIKRVDKVSSKAYSSTEVVTTSEELFPLSEIEIFGTVTNAQNGSKEGKQYDYWKTGASKKKGNSAWHTRSVSNTNSSNFVVVTSSGASNKNYNLNSSNSVKVSVAFCV